MRKGSTTTSGSRAACRPVGDATSERSCLYARASSAEMVITIATRALESSHASRA